MVGATSQQDGFVRFWVRDNGRGLTPEQCVRLFVPFERLEQARVEGHGLGLSIVQRIVTKLGGQVGVESDGVPGRGSTFYFTLAVDASAALCSAVAAEPSAMDAMAAAEPTVAEALAGEKG
jgi:signal transduction histidine kinase